MKNNRIAICFIFALLGGALLVYFWANRDVAAHYQWYDSYSAESDQPYGTLYLKNLLKEYRPDETFIYNDHKPLFEVLPKDAVLGESDAIMDYVFVGAWFYLSSRDQDALLTFISRGNNAFIASPEIPEGFVGAIFGDTCKGALNYKRRELTTVGMNFFHDSLRMPVDLMFAKRIVSEDHETGWYSLKNSDPCGSGAVITPLGSQTPGGVNFFKVAYGNGYVYFHADPLVFTNYFLAKKDHLAYTERALSHLTGKNIFWDEFSKVPEEGQKGNTSPLYFILQQPALKYAWWLLLTGVVFYICFAAKREQRVIPVLEPKVNTSLEFVNLIASLHFQNGNPLNMARKKMRYFLYFVRSKYGIQAQPFGPEHITLLSVKSTVPSEEVSIIFERFNAIENNSLYTSQTDRLLELFYSIENFKSKCR